jgi:hypothetical protein
VHQQANKISNIGNIAKKLSHLMKLAIKSSAIKWRHLGSCKGRPCERFKEQKMSRGTFHEIHFRHSESAGQ